MNLHKALPLALCTLLALSACGGGGGQSSSEGRFFILENRAGQQSGPHPLGEPGVIGVPVGERLVIRTSEPVRWRVEYEGSASSGFSRNLQFSTVTVNELTSSNPSTAWSADIAGTVPQGGRVTFTVVAETGPETVFYVNVRQ